MNKKTNINITDMDIVDVNICFSREYLTKARTVQDKERMLKLLMLANQSISNAIKQLDQDTNISQFENKVCSHKKIT